MEKMDEKFGAENLQHARDGASALVVDFGHLTEGSDITWEQKVEILPYAVAELVFQSLEDSEDSREEVLELMQGAIKDAYAFVAGK